MTTQKGESPDYDEKLGDSENVLGQLERPKIIQSWRRWMRNPLKKKKLPPVPTERPVSKEESASWFSQCLFLWMNSLMAVGYNRPLELMDFPLLNKNRRSGPLTERITKDFKKRVARGDKHALLSAINKVFFFEFWFGGLSLFFANAVMTVSPIMLKYLILYIGDAYYRDLSPTGKSIGLGIGLIAMQVAAGLSMNQFQYRGMICGGMTRASLISMIYAKSQVISNRARAGRSKEVHTPEGDQRKSNTPNKKKWPRRSAEEGSQNGWSNGQITNLMSADTYRIDQAAGWCHLLWVSPIQIIVTLIELIINIGVSALAGFGMFFVAAPILAWIIQVMARHRRRVSKITDSRVNLTEEILTGVRFVKYFAWETSFLDRLKQLRAREIRGIQFLLGIRNGLNGITVSLPVFAAVLAFVAYSLTHTSFEPATIFSSLALFLSLRGPLLMLPSAIAMTIDAYVSFGRIQDYLLAEEEVESRNIDVSLKESLKMTDASFTWEMAGQQQKDTDQKDDFEGSNLQKQERIAAGIPNAESGDEEPFHLDNLDFTFDREELVAIVGSVGSGKSSLLAALAGDMRLKSGTVTQSSSIGYCPQYAWIQNTTIKENITFGRPFEQEKYQRVIQACALQPDLDMLPQGDKTEVGERGITLSGGQKQRLNIARAIYFDANIVLLDDPLSAVDAHVGEHIFKEAICGLLRKKCRVLATHQLQILNQCDKIIWLEYGKIKATGTFNELMASNSDFEHLLSMTAEKKTPNLEDNSESETNDAIDDEENIEIGRLGKKMTAVKATAQGGLMEAEEKNKNGVEWTVWYKYVQASGSLLNAPLIVLLCCLAQAAQVMSTFWLSYWTNGTYGLGNVTYILVYVALGIAQTILTFAMAMALTIGGTNASKNLLSRALQRTLKAPMTFFDTTPLGRILNRFSKDVDVLDNFLSDAIRMYLTSIVSTLSIFILIMVYFPYFAIALVPMVCLLYFAAGYYRSSAREVKRHEAILRSHVFSRFSEALSGTSTIRAYNVSEKYRHELEGLIDDMDTCYFMTFSNQSWLSTRLNVVGNTLALITVLVVVTNHLKINPSLSAVILTYVLQVINMLQFIVKQLAQVENSMNSTERLIYYSNELPSEATPAPDSLFKPAPDWPENGEIKFEGVQMRYRNGLPLVLKGVDLHVRGGERIGIVGRTGAGKSSIMSCLFRMIELSDGRIEVDGIDISKMELYDLRNRLSIIPQDPTLFRGTVRSNLDPFNEYTDLDLWGSLRSAHLVKDIPTPQKGLPNNPESGSDEDQVLQKITLETPILSGGLNFSLGQRQLMALARALVRKSRILVCDEATSSIDQDLDLKVQTTILEGFQGSTVLCIAHRLRTIVRYDRVVVMDSGVVTECDEPLKLWSKGGEFRAMCDKSKILREDFGP